MHGEMRLVFLQGMPILSADRRNWFARHGLLWMEVVSTIRDVLKAVEGKGEIKAIGVTGQGDGFWALE